MTKQPVDWPQTVTAYMQVLWVGSATRTVSLVKFLAGLGPWLCWDVVSLYVPRLLLWGKSAAVAGAIVVVVAGCQTSAHLNLSIASHPPSSLDHALCATITQHETLGLCLTRTTQCLPSTLVSDEPCEV